MNYISFFLRVLEFKINIANGRAWDTQMINERMSVNNDNCGTIIHS